MPNEKFSATKNYVQQKNFVENKNFKNKVKYTLFSQENKIEVITEVNKNTVVI